MATLSSIDSATRAVRVDGPVAVVPIIDGERLTDRVDRYELERGMETRPGSYGGLNPAYYQWSSMPGHFLSGAFAGAGAVVHVPVLGCSCGEWGCWPLMTHIAVESRTVAWGPFEQPFRCEHDYSGFGPFRFDRAQYEGAVNRLRQAMAVTQ